MSGKPADNLILIVDDDPDICDLVSLLVRTAGFKIHAAPNGEAAIAALALKPSAIIMDLIMPGCGGLGVLKHLKGLPAPVPPVIVITAFQSRHPAVHEAVQDPLVHKCLAKPLDHEALLAALYSCTKTKPSKK